MTSKDSQQRIQIKTCNTELTFLKTTTVHTGHKGKVRHLKREEADEVMQQKGQESFPKESQMKGIMIVGWLLVPHT